jgi:hypothetical protein
MDHIQAKMMVCYALSAAKKRRKTILNNNEDSISASRIPSKSKSG